MAIYKIKTSRFYQAGIDSLTIPSGNIATEPSEKAEILNNQFKPVFTVEALNTIPVMGISPHAPINENEITQQSVLNLYTNRP